MDNTSRLEWFNNGFYDSKTGRWYTFSIEDAGVLRTSMLSDDELVSLADDMIAERKAQIWSRCPNDPVNHPAHYTQGGIECIEAIRASMHPSGFQDYCKGNVLKYIWRWRDKGGIEDLAKAQLYFLKGDLDNGKDQSGIRLRW